MVTASPLATARFNVRMTVLLVVSTAVSLTERPPLLPRVKVAAAGLIASSSVSWGKKRTSLSPSTSALVHAKIVGMLLTARASKLAASLPAASCIALLPAAGAREATVTAWSAATLLASVSVTVLAVASTRTLLTVTGWPPAVTVKAVAGGRLAVRLGGVRVKGVGGAVLTVSRRSFSV